MTRVPEPRYARTLDGAYLAYQVVGDGPVDLLFELDYFAGLDMLWENPDLAAEFRDLASFSRLILYDRRGIGLSSRNVPPPNLETRADDLRTVLDEVGSESAVLFSLLEGGAPLALVASTTPERVRALAWWNPVARSVWTPDYPWGVGPEYVTRGLAAIRDGWGTERYARTFADLNVVDRDPDWLASTAAAVWIPWIAKVTRAMATPDVAEALERIWYETDIRGVLPSIRVPTLLMGRQGFFEDEIAYVASLIPNAVVRLVPGTVSQLLGSFTEAHAELRRFLGIARPLVSHDTMLATVLFTDIVESTARQASIGDRAWKTLVERHHALVRDALGRWRGSEADTAGDGFFATFDGPARAIRCALEIVDGVRELGIEIRAGLHTGECELVDGKAAGVAVSIGARVAAQAGASEILVSQTVKDLVAGSGLLFSEAGEHQLKGVPDRWRLYRVDA